MCGICGVIAANPSLVEPATRRMMAAMVHRGPDDEGYEELPLGLDESGPVVGLGFRRLSILDLSPAGHQPIFNSQTGDCLVFNGEIYNFKHLKARLQVAGHVFRSSGDSEVLLHALSEWGEAAVDELDGMFAFAFYQASTRRVLLARGPLGIKPLYVARVGDTVVFASEVQAILASRLVPQDLDPAGIATFLAYGAQQDPLTIHHFIRSMPAGSYQWVSGDFSHAPSVAPKRYWRFPAPAPDAGASANPAESVRNLLHESVRRQCISDVPVGVFLSAGIDSATIAALAKLDHSHVTTFSVGFETKNHEDETAVAAHTAHLLGTRHFQTIVDEEWATSQFIDWLKASDRPTVDGLNTFIVSGAAKDAGITVALSGLGADELFGGYGSFSRALKLKRLMGPLAWIPRSMRRHLASLALAREPVMKRAKGAELLARGESATAVAIHSRRLFLDAQLSLLGFNCRNLGLTADFLPPEALEAFDSTDDVFHAASQVEMSLYMGNTLLRDADTFSMAHSLELRVPFLGRDLVNYVCQLQGNIRAPRRSLPKHLLRAAMKDLLPQEVFQRPKTGFTLPIDDWMRGPLRDRCEAAVEAVGQCGIFEANAVHKLWRALHDPRIDNYCWRRLCLVVLGSYLGQLQVAPLCGSPA